jgi:pimeloyl-ACP methyl ester carboxylesterase
MNRKLLFKVIKIVLLVYCLVGICLYYLQDNIFFHPKTLPPAHQFSFHARFRELNIPYSANSVMNIVQFFPENGSPDKQKDSSAQPTANGSIKGVVLYFHGNRENIERYAPAAPLFTRNGYEVWMLDYPGYGKSTGQFTEQKLYDWALVFYKLARARFSPDSIVIYGRSLGTGIATQLASVRDCRNLILETPYYSFPSLTDNYLPVYPSERLIHFKFPNWQYLQKVTAPVTIFHGTNDGVIPIRNPRRLIPFLKKDDEFISIEKGTHNDLVKFPLFNSKLDSLLTAPKTPAAQ